MISLWFAAALWAQAPPPDLYVLERPNAYDSGHQLHRYAWNGSEYGRSLVWPTLPPGNWRLAGGFLDLDNETAAVVAGFFTAQLIGVSPSGTVRWLTPLPGMCVPALDQSGDLVTAQRDASFITRLDRLGRSGVVAATIASYGPLAADVLPEWVSVDLDTGDYLVRNSSYSGPGILRVTTSGQVSSVAGLENLLYGFGLVGAMEPDYRTGAYLGAGYAGGSWQTNGWKRFFLQPAYHENLLFNVRLGPILAGITLFGSTRVFGVLPYVPNGWPAGVAELPALGGSTMSLYRLNPPPALFNGIAGSPIVVGHRKLAGLGPAAPGSEYNLLLSFPGEAGSAYVLGASLGLRPGLSLPGGAYVPLNPDPLLVWSLSDPQTFAGFTGTLDPAGRALARWRIPATPGLRGLRAFFCAVTLGPGVRTVSDPIGVTVR